MVHGGGDIVHLADGRPGGLAAFLAERARCAGGVRGLLGAGGNMTDAGGELFDRGGNRGGGFALCAGAAGHLFNGGGQAGGGAGQVFRAGLDLAEQVLQAGLHFLHGLHHAARRLTGNRRAQVASGNARGHLGHFLRLGAQLPAQGARHPASKPHAQQQG